MDDMSKADPAPEWAVTYVRGAIRIGMRVPEIEEHLVSRGLSPEAANRIVMDIVEGSFKEEAAPLDSSDRGRPLRLLASILVAGVCLWLAYSFGGQRSVGLALLWVVPELFAIWVPELTDTLDSEWGGRFWLCGWGMLLLYLAYRVFLWFMIP